MIACTLSYCTVNNRDCTTVLSSFHNDISFVRFGVDQHVLLTQLLRQTNPELNIYVLIIIVNQSNKYDNSANFYTNKSIYFCYHIQPITGSVGDEMDTVCAVHNSVFRHVLLPIVGFCPALSCHSMNQPNAIKLHLKYGYFVSFIICCH